MDYLKKQKSKFIQKYGDIAFRDLNKAIRYRTPYGAMPTLTELSKLSNVANDRLRFWLNIGIFGQEAKALFDNRDLRV